MPGIATSALSSRPDDASSADTCVEPAASRPTNPVAGRDIAGRPGARIWKSLHLELEAEAASGEPANGRNERLDVRHRVAALVLGRAILNGLPLATVRRRPEDPVFQCPHRRSSAVVA